jgi:predicted amino acid-binding ACT domain protein
MEKLNQNKVEIINEVVVTSNSTTDLDGVTDKEVTRTVTNRINLENLSEDLIRDYFGLKVTIDWENKKNGT